MPHRKLWTPADDALLGTASDSVIANRVKRRRATVTLRRSTLNIPAFGKTANPRSAQWSSHELNMLVHYPDAELATILSRNLEEVKAKRLELKTSSSLIVHHDVHLWLASALT